MTVAVATRAQDGTVIMAADSQVQRGYLKQRGTPKIHRVGCMLVTGAGNAAHVLRFALLLDSRWQWSPEVITPVGSLQIESVARQWVASLRADGFGVTGDDGWQAGTSILCAWDGGIWYVDGFGAATMVSEPYMAVGTGAEVATGALWAMSREAGNGVGHEVSWKPFPSDWTEEEARKAAYVAVQAACVHAVGCEGKVQVEALVPPLE